MSAVKLSVVVACVDAAGSIERCLSSLRDACVELASEIIVVDSSGDEAVARSASSIANARVLRYPPGTLTPQLWAHGFGVSTGNVVAFTIAQCSVTREWARALTQAIDAGATGAGGGFELDESATVTDAAVFYLRYSAFLTSEGKTIRTTMEIAGDNAAYRREALDRHAASFGGGFWEVEFHRRIRAEGAVLALVPEATARFAGATRLGAMMRHRFAHGQHSGAMRVSAAERRRWQVILAAPLVPGVLLLRIAGRLRPTDRHRFLRALPAMLLLAGAWATGEAWGALTSAGLRAAGEARA